MVGKLQKHVTRCNLSRNAAKSRNLAYFSCNLQRNFLVARHVAKRGCYKCNFGRNLSRNAVALQVVEKIALCNSAFSNVSIK